MNTKIIECFVHDEIVKGGGVTIGAQGSGNDVVLKLTFSELWDSLAKTITWYDAIEESPTIGILTEQADGTYLATVPFGAKKYPGEARFTIKGSEVDDHEISAEINTTTWDASTLGGTDGTYVFTFNGTAWKYLTAEVTLSTYGVTVTGTPIDGDKITVVRATGEETAITISDTENHPELRVTMSTTAKFKVLPSNYDQNALEDNDFSSTWAEQVLFSIEQMSDEIESFEATVEGRLDAQDQNIAQFAVDASAALSDIEDARTGALGDISDAQSTAESAIAEDVAAADASAKEAEAWAKGTKNGIDVVASDDQYNNHAKHWAGVSNEYAVTAQTQAGLSEAAKDAAVLAKDGAIAAKEDAEDAADVASGSIVGAQAAEEQAQIYAAAAQSAKDDAMEYMMGLLSGTIIPQKAEMIQAATASGTNYNVLIIPTASGYQNPYKTADMIFNVVERMLTLRNLTVTGNLDVQGTTTTVHAQSVSTQEKFILMNSSNGTLVGLSGFVVLKGNGSNAIGIVYDATDGYLKLGDGTLTAGVFSFNEGEAQRLATIADSVTDGNLVEYDNTTKKLVDTGYKASDFRTKGDFTAVAVGDGTYSLQLNNGYSVEENSDGTDLGTQCYTITLEGD